MKWITSHNEYLQTLKPHDQVAYAKAHKLTAHICEPYSDVPKLRIETIIKKGVITKFNIYNRSGKKIKRSK